MGTLVAMHYPLSDAVLGAVADHTYVRCETGAKAWSCWGGKTGGAVLREGEGSTVRADAIAEPNGRAHISCYLVNGVCHQSANRILLPAGITVQGSKGYEVSVSLFGTYGRPRGVFGLCKSPFDQHASLAGDLPGCTPPPAPSAAAPASARRPRPATNAKQAPDPKEAAYLRKTLAIYRKAERGTASLSAAGREDTGMQFAAFQLELFDAQVEYRLGSAADTAVAGRLGDVRLSTERARLKLEEWYARREMTAVQFAAAFNKETLLFQDSVASVLRAGQYRKLTGLGRDERVLLADPAVIRRLPRKVAQ